MNTEICWFCSFFLFWFFPYCSQSSQLSELILKNLIEFPKIEKTIRPPLIWLNLTLQANFRITLVLEKVNSCVYLLNILHKETQRNTTKPKELILTPFSLFEIKCKKLNAKNHWKCIFGPSRKVSFSYFPMFPLDHGGSPPFDTL